MIIVMKPTASKESVERVVKCLKARGLQVDEIVGTQKTVLGLVGDTAAVDEELLQSYDCIEKVMRVQEPYKRASRAFHPDDSVIDVGGVKVGGKKLAVIAGPCSIETPEQITGVAKAVAAAGADILRGGAFKPRTSPYSFQGLGEKGLDTPVRRGGGGASPRGDGAHEHGQDSRFPREGRETSSRSARGICRISTCSKRWAA